MKRKFSKKKLMVIGIVLVIILLLIFLFYKFIFSDNKNPYGKRCDQRYNYQVTDKQMKNIKKKFKEIEEVNSVDVYTKLCTIKIMVNLSKDVELDVIKNKAKEIFEIFEDEELELYDFALYITSDNSESEIYPINVSKHNTREDFAW